MSLGDSISVIESHEFAARVNIANDFNAFAAATAAEEAFLAVQEEPAHAPRVAERVLELLRRRVDVRYENPWDTAMAAYLLALLATNRGLAELVAPAVLQTSQLWWASKIARHVLAERRIDSSDAVSGLAGLAVGVLPRAIESTDLIVWLPVGDGALSGGAIHGKSGFASSSRAQDWRGGAGDANTFRVTTLNERAVA